MSQFALEIKSLTIPYKEVLERNIAALKSRPDVLAIGLAGSVARNDLWAASDLDIEIILKGKRPTLIVCTEQTFETPEHRGVSVDFGYFSQKDVLDRPYETLPYDTRLIYDPTGLMSKILSQRDPLRLRRQLVTRSMRAVSRRLESAKRAVRRDPYSALGYIHEMGWALASGLTICAGENPTIRRTASKLEHSMRKIGRADLFESFCALYGLPDTLAEAEYLLKQLELGYREIWRYFHGRQIGPRYMLQQPHSSAWFRNRIEPLLEHDGGDLVCIVYGEFFFVLHFIYATVGKHVPADFVAKAVRLRRRPRLWMKRYERILRLIPENRISECLRVAKELASELRRMSRSNIL